MLLGALAPGDRRDAVARVLLDETTTLGVRFHPVDRIELDRELVPVATAYGEVRVKVARRRGDAVGAHTRSTTTAWPGPASTACPSRKCWRRPLAAFRAAGERRRGSGCDG